MTNEFLQNEKLAICPDCGTNFACGAIRGTAHCWCMTVPAAGFQPEEGGLCYCKSCLEKRIARRTRESHNEASFSVKAIDPLD